MADYRIRVYVDPSGAVAGSRPAENAIRRIGAAADDVRTKSVPGLMDKLRTLSTTLKVGAIVAGVLAYARMSDTISTANSQLRLASRNQSDLNRLQAQSYRIAQQNGVAWSATATLVAKSTKAARGMGFEMERAMQLGVNASAAVAAGIRVSGTNAAAAAAGVFQLSQALASGVLRGDELNSVMENIPGVADALARALGVSTGQLRSMGKEGELTSKKVIEGLEKARPELERLAALIPLTFSGAFEKVKNSASRLFTSMDKEGFGIGGALIGAMNLISKAMDMAANHAEALSNIALALVVAWLAKTAAGARLAGAAALQAAKDNAALAASELAVAKAQQQRAISSLAVARSMNGRGVASNMDVKRAAADVATATANVGRLQVATNAAGAAVTSAAGRVGLFGRAFTAASTVARTALAAIGGPIGLIVAAIAGLVLWAGKAALSFQPIKGEAGQVSDYIAVAFEDATKWVSTKFQELSAWAGKKLQEIGKYVRPVAVFIIDVFLMAARGAAGAVGGIVAAWRAGVDNIKGLLAGLSADAAAATRGEFTTAGTRAALGRTVNLGTAFAQGYGQSSSIMKDVSGESVVSAIEELPTTIRNGLESWAKESGWRERANARRKATNDAANTGGDAGPGTPGAAAADKDKKEKKKKEKDERTFADILSETKEQARLAGLVTYERERESAVLEAQKELKRDLTDTEAQQLRSAVQLRQTNEANMALYEETLAVQQSILEAKVAAAAEDARISGNSSLAVALEAELAVQKKLNEAKAAGVELDKAKVDAYREAVIQAGIENEVIRKQQEAKEALKSIADEARKSIQNAVSDAIYGALNGDIKGIKGLFKTLGNIFKRQLAEQITYGLFQKGNQVDQNTVTRASVDVAMPAARAVVAAGQNIVNAMNQAASSISSGPGGVDPLAPLAEGIDTAAQVWTEGSSDVAKGISAVTNVFGQGASGLGGVIGQVIGVLGQLLGLGGMGGVGAGGGPGGILGMFGQGGVLGKLTGSLGKFGGILSKVGSGAMYGQIGSGLAGMVGLGGGKWGSIGGTLGGIAGSFIPGIGNILGPVIGGFLGSAIGGLFKKTKWGRVTLTSSGVGRSEGNSGKAEKASKAAGNSIMDTLRGYAEALGGTLGDFGKITIGQRHGDWRVNIGKTSLKKKKGAKDFNDDYEAAIAYALEQAIKRGAIAGIDAGISAAIKSGKASVEEAVEFTKLKKGIDRQAMGLVDPVRAAIMEVDDQYKLILDQYRKFNQDTTNLEKVYLDTRQKAIDAALQEQLGSVKDLLAELQGGSLGGRSLTEQFKFQDTAFKAMEAQLAQGKAVDYDALSEVGRALIEANRELNGATPDFYAQVDRVTAALNSAISIATTTAGSTPLPAPIDMTNTVTTPITGSLSNINNTLVEGFGGLMGAIVQAMNNREGFEAFSGYSRGYKTMAF